MKRKLKLGLLFALMTTLASSVFVRGGTLRSEALDNFVDENGTIHYGWSLIANEINQSVWNFDENGQIDYIYAAEGDTANQRIFNYGLRNLAVDAEADYHISATFTPDPDSDLSVERAYGIVPWYQDENNYLIYWLQQKLSGDWSGQFYGRIDGAFRKMWVPEQFSGAIQSTDYWLKGEYYDMWWDSSYAHSALKDQRNVLLTTPVTMHVVSTLDEATVGAVTKLCRRFEVRQTVNGIEEALCAFYVEQIDGTTGDFYTGLYSEAFSVGISDFNLDVENATFVSDVEASIADLAETIENEAAIQTVIDSHVAYENLLNMKDDVAAASVTKLENAELAVGAYIDGRITALDINSATFVDDVASVVALYSNLPSYLSRHVSKTDALVQAIADAENWHSSSENVSEPPLSSEPGGSQALSSDNTQTSTPSDSEGEADNNSTGLIIGIASGVVVLAGVVAFFIYKRRK